MQPIILENKELEEFFNYRYQGQTTKLIDEFLTYLNTQKKAYEINKSLHQIKLGKQTILENSLINFKTTELIN